MIGKEDVNARNQETALMVKRLGLQGDPCIVRVYLVYGENENAGCSPQSR